jgi:hypothetical protein
MRGLLLVLLVVAVCDAYSFVRPAVLDLERLRLRMFGAGVGAMLVVPLLPSWAPADAFGAFCRFREFTALALAAGHSAAWWYIRSYRPVPCSPLVRRHGLLLCAWLWTYWVASTSAKGGTLWLLFTWNGGQALWQAHNKACLVAQIGLMATWCVIAVRLPKQTPLATRYYL